MSSHTHTLIWLVAGVLLIAAELVAPGFVVIFLGMGALLVAGLRALGLIESVVSSVAAWLVLSTALAATLRSTVQRWSRPERSCQGTDEDVDAFDREVEVVSRVGPGEKPGRIRYGGTTWLARAASGSALEPGSRARLLHRENLCWVVEPALPPPPEPPAAQSESPSDPPRDGAVRC